MADATLAGIARSQDLLIFTHNGKHLLLFGVEVATPEEAAGPG
jgi:hypothetical protein